VIWELNLLFLIFAVVAAWTALEVKDLLAAVLLLGGFSFFMCLVWAEMGAVDVAFTEAAVGVGVSTAFFVAAVCKTTRRTRD